MEECPICKKSLEDGTARVRLSEKGVIGIQAASAYSPTVIEVQPGNYVHVKCRKDLTRPQKKLTENNEQDPKRILRTHTNNFDFKSRCLFCANYAKFSSKTRKRSHDIFPVRTLDFQNKIMDICQSRNDLWAIEIHSRLNQVLDLPAAEAIYHQTCSVNFRTGKGIPKTLSEPNTGTNSIKSPGRPTNDDQAEAFKAVVEYIENNENESLTISDLVKKMFEICGEKCYSAKHMKRKIVEHFGESVIVSSIDGKNDIVALRESVYSIVHTFYKTSVELSDEEKKREIIETAAKLIEADIKSIASVKDKYPSFTDISSKEENLNVLPDSLKGFLGKLFSDKNHIKTVAIGQSLMQSCRPKGLLPPLQLGLGVQLHHHFGSRFLIDTLNSLGFCCSYYEVQKYETNAAAVLSTDIPCQESSSPFLQFAADNHAFSIPFTNIESRKVKKMMFRDHKNNV